MSDSQKKNKESNHKPPILWAQTMMFVITMAIALIAVPWYGFTTGYHWSQWTGFVFILGANGIAITAGYHRLWAHNAYKAHPILRMFYALFGAAAFQNSILIWASGHRRHHRHVDDIEHDPYSAQKGLWFSHMGWMIRDYPAGRDDFANARDLQRDKIVMWQHNHYMKIALAMNFIPAMLVGWACGDIVGGIMLAGVLRLVVSHHTTFFINSLAHFWGRQPYTDENSARDNGILALFTYGEGYHNYHHIFQNDYRNGIRWWHFDPTKWLIKSCSWVGLASDLKKIPNFKIQRALIAMQFKRAEEKLKQAKAVDVNAVTEFLEYEYQQFAASLQEWKQLSQKAYSDSYQQLVESKELLQQKWEEVSLKSRFKELEYTLKMQAQRLHMLTLELQAAAA
ncbi:MAG: stearoyl-CoA desaturase (delta-9 desaturase) [Bermanella sp.]|jgi:stearoyl-CoA desaturase (delta-9 desaturase)